MAPARGPPSSSPPAQPAGNPPRRVRLLFGALLAFSATLTTIPPLARTLVLPHFFPPPFGHVTGAPALRVALLRLSPLRPAARLCVLYDRPPRTGSSTVSRALTVCLRRSAFSIVHSRVRDEWPATVAKLTRRLDAERRGAVEAHMYLTRRDVREVRAGCASLLYVTSARPMGERLLSKLKFTMLGGNTNGSVTVGRLEAAMKRHNLTEYEHYLERYPYVEEDVPQEEVIVPDYVIRTNHLINDTIRLLVSLNCSNFPSGRNMHAVRSEPASTSESAGEGGDDSSKEKEDVNVRLVQLAAKELPLSLQDARYRFLSQLAAKRNDDGLRKAASFFQ